MQCKLTDDIRGLFTDQRDIESLERTQFLLRLGSTMRHAEGCDKLAVPESWWKRTFKKKTIAQEQAEAKCSCGLEDSFKQVATMIFLIKDHLRSIENLMPEMSRAKALARNPKSKQEIARGMLRLTQINQLCVSILMSQDGQPEHDHENCACEKGEDVQEEKS